MFDLNAYLIGLAAILAAGVLTWLISLLRKDVSIVDSLWAPMFFIAALAYALSVEAPGERTTLVLALVGLWALRLSGYITWRNHGEPEDRRYQQIRANNEPGFAFKSLYIVFGLQGVLAWVISLPLLAAIAGQGPLGWLDYAGVALWLIGMSFEAGGDFQLARFKADPANKGKVMDRGLWRYTRHPNYFGNACIWWGLFLIALAAGGWWAVLAPALMTFLLLKVSGVSMLEKDIHERRPEYRAYIERTNAFIPGPPRRPRPETPGHEGDEIEDDEAVRNG
jgi:steroid 5-alpha reductase family enzyme